MPGSDSRDTHGLAVCFLLNEENEQIVKLLNFQSWMLGKQEVPSPT